MTANIFPKRNQDPKIEQNRKQNQNPIRIKVLSQAVLFLLNISYRATWTKYIILLLLLQWCFATIFFQFPTCQPLQNAGSLRWLQRQVKTGCLCVNGTFQVYFHRFSKMLNCIIILMNSEVILFWSVKICVNAFNVHSKNWQK